MRHLPIFAQPSHFKITSHAPSCARIFSCYVLTTPILDAYNKMYHYILWYRQHGRTSQDDYEIRSNAYESVFESFIFCHNRSVSEPLLAMVTVVTVVTVATAHL